MLFRAFLYSPELGAIQRWMKHIRPVVSHVWQKILKIPQLINAPTALKSCFLYNLHILINFLQLKPHLSVSMTETFVWRKRKDLFSPYSENAVVGGNRYTYLNIWTYYYWHTASKQDCPSTVPAEVVQLCSFIFVRLKSPIPIYVSKT